jgi:hypothetical protein
VYSFRTHLSAPVLARWSVSPNASLSAGWHSGQYLRTHLSAPVGTVASFFHLSSSSSSSFSVSERISQRRFWLSGQYLRTHLSAPVGTVASFFHLSSSSSSSSSFSVSERISQRRLAQWPVSPNASFSAGCCPVQSLCLSGVVVARPSRGTGIGFVLFSDGSAVPL